MNRVMNFRCTLVAVMLVGGLLAPGPALAGASLEKATSAEKRDAGNAYTRGMAAFQKKRYAEALAEFEKSFAVVKSPNALLMVARCFAQMGELLKAHEAFVETEHLTAGLGDLAARYEATAQASLEERLELEKQLGWASVLVKDAKPGYRVMLGERELQADEWGREVIVLPGSFEVELVTPEGTIRETLVVPVGAKASVTLTAPVAQPAGREPEPEVAREQPAPVKPRSRALLYTAAGLGAVGVGSFAIFGASSRSKYDDLKSACSGNVCDASLRSKARDGRADQVLANSGLVVGVFGLTAATLLWLAEEPRAEGDAVTADVFVGPRSVALRGRF
jgi:tetratricopeptide (TPR) repeat protein